MNTSPDGASAASPEPDAHGQAALLLAESTLHMLIETGALTLPQAIETVRTASEVKVELATRAGESPERIQESLVLLGRISRSLASDMRLDGDGRAQRADGDGRAFDGSGE